MAYRILRPEDLMKVKKEDTYINIAIGSRGSGKMLGQCDSIEKTIEKYKYRSDVSRETIKQLKEMLKASNVIQSIDINERIYEEQEKLNVCKNAIKALEEQLKIVGDIRKYKYIDPVTHTVETMNIQSKVDRKIFYG